MEAVQTSETVVNSYQSTRRYNLENSHLHSLRRGNLKSYEEDYLRRGMLSKTALSDVFSAVPLLT
jgi:hypothetical protein